MSRKNIPARFFLRREFIDIVSACLQTPKYNHMFAFGERRGEENENKNLKFPMNRPQKSTERMISAMSYSEKSIDL